MTRAKRLQKDEIETIINLIKSGMSGMEIARTSIATYNQINEIKKKYGLTQKQNLQFDFNSVQEQILISGKLGDGNYKKNGQFGYFYRESHAEHEYEYLLWKSQILGEDIINKSDIYNIKNGGYSKGLDKNYFGFSTKTSRSFAKYANMSKKEAISKLNLFGLILFILDDGWKVRETKTGVKLCISSGELNNEELDLIINKFKEFGICNVIKIGKRKDLSIPTKYSAILFEHITKYIPKDTDIIQKKFSFFI